MRPSVPRPINARINAKIDTSSHMDTALGRGMDVAFMTLLFLGGGYLLDRWLGTKPLFMIVLTLLALVGEFVRIKVSYEAKMRSLEEQRRTAARAGGR